MARDDKRSLTDLQEDAQRSRVALSETVDQLRSKVSDTVTGFRKRVSPEAMKEEVSGYLRTRADALMDKARENPLQAAAIGLGIAYPLLGIVRAIPAPVIMIGAGLFFLGSSSGQRVSSDLSRKLGAVGEGVSGIWGAGVGAASEKVHDARDMAAAGLATARDAISSNLGSVTRPASASGATLSQLKDGAASLVNSASNGAANLKQQALDAAGTTSDAVREGAARTGAMVRDTAGSAADFGADTAVQLRDRAVETSQRASSAIGDAIQRHPLLVGGLGLAAGMLIAGALPRSDIEKGIMGSASVDLRKRANVLASRGFDAAKGIASGAIADLADHAGQESLTPADLNDAAEDIGRRVRKVAESATEAAFGGPNEKIIDAA